MRKTPVLAILLALAVAACVAIPTDETAVAQLPPRPTHPPPTTVAVATPKPTSSVVATTPPPADSPTAEPTDSPTESPTDTANPSPTTAPTPTSTPVEPTATANLDDPACTDDSFELEGFAWTQPFKWYFNADSVPSTYNADEVLVVLKRAFDNVTNENNDCGRPDRISAEATYMGTTTLKPCLGDGDEKNVIAFGLAADLSPDTIAYTCPFTFQGSGDIAEADIVIGTEVDWAVNLADCRSQELMEPTLTHEVGHVFGLGHVSERQHPLLTMSTRSDGPCDDRASTLGLGDMLGLEQLYP